jgi:hypothetical protein
MPLKRAIWWVLSASAASIIAWPLASALFGIHIAPYLPAPLAERPDVLLAGPCMMLVASLQVAALRLPVYRALQWVVYCGIAWAAGAAVAHSVIYQPCIVHSSCGVDTRTLPVLYFGIAGAIAGLTIGTATAALTPPPACHRAAQPSAALDR